MIVTPTWHAVATIVIQPDGRPFERWLVSPEERGRIARMIERGDVIRCIRDTDGRRQIVIKLVKGSNVHG